VIGWLDFMEHGWFTFELILLIFLLPIQQKFPIATEVVQKGGPR